MTVPGVNPNRISDTPLRGLCWVCDEPNVPLADLIRIPAICSEGCRAAWVRMLAIGGEEDNPSPDPCPADANLAGEPGAVAHCQLPVGHYGYHVDNDVTWTWDKNPDTGFIWVNIMPRGIA